MCLVVELCSLASRVDQTLNNSEIPVTIALLNRVINEHNRMGKALIELKTRADRAVAEHGNAKLVGMVSLCI